MLYEKLNPEMQRTVDEFAERSATGRTPDGKARMKILVDADACPVKDEIYRVARRHGLSVTLVANSPMTTPNGGWVRLEVVAGRFDAADDRIVEQAEAGDVVISDDIPLAARCLEKGAWVLSPKGRRFTEDNIGDALAAREILSQLRDGGVVTGGPAPFGRKHRSRFLEQIEETIREARRSSPGA
jgi:hypothetical protein